MKRRALLIGNQEFDDPGLVPLKSPVHDVARLAGLLKREEVGGFIVESHCNVSAQQMRVIIQRFCDSASQDDQNLIFLSGHGIKDRFNTLHFAARDTQLDALNATAVDNKYFMERVDQSPASQQIIFIDTCYSGSINKGTIFKSARGTLVSEDDFRTDNMVGKAIITASTGSQVARELELDGSFTSAFTNCLFEGIAKGAADKNNTGVVTLGEMFEYISAGVRRLSPDQSPQPYYFGLSDRTVISLNPRRRFDESWEESARKRISSLYSKDIVSRRIQKQVFELLETLDQREATHPALKLIDSLLARKLTNARFIEAWYLLHQSDQPTLKRNLDHSTPGALPKISDGAAQQARIGEDLHEPGSEFSISEDGSRNEGMVGAELEAPLGESAGDADTGEEFQSGRGPDVAVQASDSDVQIGADEIGSKNDEEQGTTEIEKAVASDNGWITFAVCCASCIILAYLFFVYALFWTPIVVTAFVFMLRFIVNRRNSIIVNIATWKLYFLPMLLAFASILNISIFGPYIYHSPHELDVIVTAIAIISALNCFLHDYSQLSFKSPLHTFVFRIIRAATLALFFLAPFLGGPVTAFLLTALPLFFCYIELVHARIFLREKTISKSLAPIDPRDF